MTAAFQGQFAAQKIAAFGFQRQERLAQRWGVVQQRDHWFESLLRHLIQTPALLEHCSKVFGDLEPVRRDAGQFWRDPR